MTEKCVYAFKLILVGDSGVGKSSLIRRYVNNEFDACQNLTLGCDYLNHQMTVDGESVSLQIWDTSGHERFRNIVYRYYEGTHGFMVVYNVTEDSSFSKGVPEWLKSIEERCPKAEKILVGNKTDEPERREVTSALGLTFANRTDLILLETSARLEDRKQLDQAFLCITRQMIQVEKQRRLEAKENNKRNTLEIPSKRNTLEISNKRNTLEVPNKRNTLDIPK